MPESRYDCIVIGSGPGGYVAAIRAAQLGLKTAVVEKGNVGGRCLNEACIPAKAILRVAEVFSEVEHAGQFGVQVPDGTSVDWKGATKHRDKVVKTLTGGVSMLFEKNKIDLIEGFGTAHRRRQREDRRGQGRHRDRDRPRDPRHRLGGQAAARPEVRRPGARHRRHLAARRAAQAPGRDRRRRVRHRGGLGLRPPRHRGAPARGARPDPAARGRRDRQGLRARDRQAEREHRDRRQASSRPRRARTG